ncbi:MAG: hypothetical protein WAU81_08010, partial [Candidatus Aminicenantales bacterium]
MMNIKKRKPVPRHIARALFSVLFAILLTSCSGGGSKAVVGERVRGVEELSRLDLLPRFKPSVKVGLVSS